MIAQIMIARIIPIKLSKLVNHFLGGKRFFDIPTICYSLSQHGSRHSKFISPRRYTGGLSIVFYNYVVSLVSHLGFISRPATVFFRVIAVYVYAVYRGIPKPIGCNMAEIAFVHIIPKIKKVIPSALDTATTVYSPANVVWIVTASPHGAVDIIERGICQTMRRIHLSKGLNLFFGECAVSENFQKITTTTLSLFLNKVVAFNKFLVSAIADTFPNIITTISLTTTLDYQQTTEPLACQILKIGHNFTKNGYTLSRMYPSLVLS